MTIFPNERRKSLQEGDAWWKSAVVYHSSDEHPWLIESKSSIDNIQRDWYRWRPARKVNQTGDCRAEPGYDGAALLHALAESSRDNARTPVQWDDSANAGFTSGAPWLAVNPNAGTINAKQAVADKESVFHYYSQLIQLRHEMPIVVHGDFRLLLDEDERIFAYTRASGNEQLLVLGNFSDEDVTVLLDEEWAAQAMLIGNYPVAAAGPELNLRPWETRVYHRH